MRNTKWSALEKQKVFLDQLQRVLGYPSQGEFYGLTLEVLTEHGGGGIVDIYKNSVPTMLEAVYPDYNWEFWKFPKAPNGCWNTLAKQRKFMGALGVELGYANLDGWYTCMKKTIQERGGHGSFNIYTSIIDVLKAVYPEHPWVVWNFKNARLAWGDRHVQKGYMEHLKGVLGYTTMDDRYKLTAKHFGSNNGNMVFEQNSRSPMKVLKNVYPEFDWKPWRFLNCPKDTWDKFENHKGFMDDLKVKLGFETMEDWYKLTYDILIAHKGRQLLGRYNFSTSLVIKTVYSEFTWIDTKFHSHYSQVSLEWLRYIEKKNNIKIQHAENGGEYKIPGTGFKADGYCVETNTIFEFHGDLWHSNPTKYPYPEGMNVLCKKTHWEVYAQTMKREQSIRDLGYNIVVMWEMDWGLMNKKAKLIQRAFRKRKLFRRLCTGANAKKSTFC